MLPICKDVTRPTGLPVRRRRHDNRKSQHPYGWKASLIMHNYRAMERGSFLKTGDITGVANTVKSTKSAYGSQARRRRVKGKRRKLKRRNNVANPKSSGGFGRRLLRLNKLGSKLYASGAVNITEYIKLRKLINRLIIRNKHNRIKKLIKKLSKMVNSSESYTGSTIAKKKRLAFFQKNTIEKLPSGYLRHPESAAEFKSLVKVVGARRAYFLVTKVRTDVSKKVEVELAAKRKAASHLKPVLSNYRNHSSFLADLKRWQKVVKECLLCYRRHSTRPSDLYSDFNYQIQYPGLICDTCGATQVFPEEKKEVPVKSDVVSGGIVFMCKKHFPFPAPDNIRSSREFPCSVCGNFWDKK